MNGGADEALRKRCIVGVIGGDDSMQVEAARQVGAELARAGHFLLTGGTPMDTNHAKDPALRRRKHAEESSGSGSLRARMIGILKSRTIEWATPEPCRLFLMTGLSSFE